MSELSDSGGYIGLHEQNGGKRFVFREEQMLGYGEHGAGDYRWVRLAFFPQPILVYETLNEIQGLLNALRKKTVVNATAGARAVDTWRKEQLEKAKEPSVKPVEAVESGGEGTDAPKVTDKRRMVLAKPQPVVPGIVEQA